MQLRREGNYEGRKSVESKQTSRHYNRLRVNLLNVGIEIRLDRELDIRLGSYLF